MQVKCELLTKYNDYHNTLLLKMKKSYARVVTFLTNLYNQVVILKKQIFISKLLVILKTSTYITGGNSL